MVAVLFLGTAQAQVPALTVNPLVTGTLNAQFTVSSIEVSVPFYRDVLGLEVVPDSSCCLGAGGYFYRDRLAPGRGGTAAPGPGAAPATNAVDRGNAGPTAGAGGGLTGVVGGMPRFVRMVVPGGVIWKIQLIEMTNVERRRVNPRVQDIGAAGFILYVRDLDLTLAALKKAGATIVTKDERPVHIGMPGRHGRAILASDPDGFGIEVRQLDPLPASAAAIPGNVLDVGISVSIENTDETVRYWHDLLDFELQPAAGFGSDKAMRDLYGIPKARLRTTVARHPAAPATWEFHEFQSVERRTLAPRIQDPGNAAFVLLTADVGTLLDRVKADSQSRVLSNGGDYTAPSDSGNGAFFFQDPNGFILEGCKGCGIGQR